MFKINKILPVIVAILLHVLICRSSESNCSLEIDAGETDFISHIEKGAKLIYIYLNATDIVTASTRNEYTMNQFVEWIWVKQDYMHLLSYPVFIDYFTFGLMRKDVENSVISAKPYNNSDCLNISATDIPKFLFNLSNVTFSGKLCHRNFKNQMFKHNLTQYTGVSIGYDFDCISFDSSVTETIHKSLVVYLVIIIVSLVILYYPMLLTIVFDRKTANEEIVILTEADYPFILRRGLLHVLFKSYTKKDLSDNECLTSLHNTFKKRGANLEFLIISIRVFALIAVFFSLVFYLTKVYIISSNYVSNNLTGYPTVYHINDLRLSDLDFTEVIAYITLCYLSIFILCQSESDDDYFFLLDFTRLCYFRLPFLILPISIFSKDPQKEIEKNGNGLPVINSRKFKCNKLQYEENKYKQSVTIASKIIYKFVLILSPKFWCKVFLLPFFEFKIISCKSFFCFFVIIIQFVLNVVFILIFTLFPIFSSLWNASSFMFSMFVKCLAYAFSVFDCSKRAKKMKLVANIELILRTVFSLAYPSMFLYVIPKYCLVFHGISFCIQFFIYVAFIAIPHFDPAGFRNLFFATVAFSYLLKFITDYIEFYREVLLKILEIMNIQQLSVKKFDEIIAQVFPVRNEFFTGVVKVTFTSFILVILHYSLTDIGYIEGENSFDVSTVFGFAFVLLSPGILHKLIFNSSEGRINKQRKQLMDVSTKILKEKPEKDIHNADEEKRSQNLCLKCFKDCFVFIYLLTCGCLGTPTCTDRKGHCECCVTIGDHNGKLEVMEIKTESYKIADVREIDERQGYKCDKVSDSRTFLRDE